MKQFIGSVLLGVLMGIIPTLLPAQQSQYTQKSNPEIDDLKQRVSDLEKQLQIVENIEKMELARNYTDAQAKLLNAEFGKFERGLRDSNDEWLRIWGIVVFTVLAVVGGGALAWVKSRANQLISDRVEKSLTGFKEAVAEQELIKNQLGILEKEHAASTLSNYIGYRLDKEEFHPEEIIVLRDETLVQIFGDERYDTRFRYNTAVVLAARKSPRLVSPLLETLNSSVDSNADIVIQTQRYLCGYINLLGHIYTLETYQGLKEFLNRLLRDNPRHKELFLTWTVFALGRVSVELELRDSVSVLMRAIPHLTNLQNEPDAISSLVEHFDILNEPKGIKEILTNHLTGEISGMEEVEDKCLELLEKHDPKFVEEWRARKAADEVVS